MPATEHRREFISLSESKGLGLYTPISARLASARGLSSSYSVRVFEGIVLFILSSLLVFSGLGSLLIKAGLLLCPGSFLVAI